MPEEPRSQPEAAAKPAPRPDKPGGQARGEEAIQVNDPYGGGGEPPGGEPAAEDDQHPTGG